MFNIFVNGIVETLQDENSDPVLIGNTSINTLLYADDLVLLSSSPQGLQNCLEKLSVFCASWKLVVNISKNYYFTPKNHSFYNYGGGREKFWGISCEKSRFYAQKTYFFPIINPVLCPRTVVLSLVQLY
jgi:hypothetical protein